MPETKVLAKVYQLNMVLYQCASILMIQSHGMVDATVNVNTTQYNEAQTVFFQIHFFPVS